MKKTNIIIVVILLSISLARANLIQIGQVSFTGNFTLNHLYDFNHPESQPFGTFDLQTVTGASGIFAPFVHTGDTIGNQPLFTATNLPLFSLDGYTFSTNFVNISGADSGRFVLGIVDLSGNGYIPNSDNTINWSFTAPSYDSSNFPVDVTGVITLTFNALHDNHHVPDDGSTFLMLSIGIVAIIFSHRRTKA